MASTAGVAPATSTFAEWRSDLSELRGHLALGHLASVIGLAPIRPGLKDRLRELLCIHGPTECRIKNAECRMTSFGHAALLGLPILHSAFFVLHLYVRSGRNVAMTDTSPASTRFRIT